MTTKKKAPKRDSAAKICADLVEAAIPDRNIFFMRTYAINEADATALVRRAKALQRKGVGK